MFVIPVSPTPDCACCNGGGDTVGRGVVKTHGLTSLAYLALFNTAQILQMY